MNTIDPLSPSDLLLVLEKGEMEIEGLVPWGSNDTFLVRLTHEERTVQGIYKPRRGEQPLWDFAAGTLCLRERAAFVLSEQLGWSLVPTTLLRSGPQGVGSVQYFIDHDPEQHYFMMKDLPAAASPTDEPVTMDVHELLEMTPLQAQFVPPLQKIALFDIIINNADRKGGHVLLDEGGKVWAIDHGICFHEEPKLRTVIWDFAGQPIPEPLLADIGRVFSPVSAGNDPLGLDLASLLSQNEVEAMQKRAQGLLENRLFPRPRRGRHYPWPLL